MNTIPKISILAFALALLPMGLAVAAEKPVPPQPVTQSSASSGQVKAAPVSKKAKAKKRSKRRGKAYSKATMSAFQPMPQTRTQSVQGSQSAASIALSPMVNKDAVQRPEQTAAPGSDSSGFVIPDVNTAYDEETSNAQHERPTDAVGESSELGQESVSVIDRFADKPKAKPLANGPLRVRMKDSGLRASVQIPLTTEK